MKNKSALKSSADDKMNISVQLNSNNIIEIDVPLSLTKIKKRHLVDLNKRIHELGEGKKLPAYITINGFVLLSRGAINYRTTSEYAKYRLANAFLTDSFSKMVIYKFYKDFDYSKVPVNSFSSKHKAIQWLKTFG
ncbi:DUF7793 family protein [Aurantibacillus circumpalustris]|uniref:DUF7793 family protein n=1 Tax=Aurantibacillus circumpalustris TaxID=3036359 RepID=UPI00295B6B6E|nr:hypothetical protein [Aurantibacillus circumpalustris]